MTERMAFPTERTELRGEGERSQLILASSEKAYRLNPVARAIAEELQRPVLVSRIEQRLRTEFDIDGGTCSDAVRSFLDDLRTLGIIEVIDDDPEAPMRRRYLDLLQRALVNLIYPEHELRIDELEARGRAGDRLAHERRMRDLRYLEPETFTALLQHKADGLSWNRRPSRFAHTMIGLRRLDNLEYCAAHVFANGIAGDFLEAGVLQGGASIYLRALQVAYGEAHRRTWLADSFAGPPPAEHALDRPFTEYAESAEPWLAASLTSVQDNFRTYDLLSDHVCFLAGPFAESLRGAPVGRLAILRFDAGLFQAAMDVLENLYDAVSPGGFIVIDDYLSFEPCRQAVDEFRARRGDRAPLRFPDWNSAYWQKGR